MVNYVIVSLGAALGGGLHYGLSKGTYFFLPISFPYGTLMVNITGSFLLGLMMFYLALKRSNHKEVLCLKLL